MAVSLVDSALFASAALSADLEPLFDAWEVFDLKDTISATLPQPLLRDIRYRAFERAYTAVLNDPNKLVLNVPTNHIAYPPLSRTLATSFIRYEAIVLPEVDPDPWQRQGSGGAAIVSGSLVITDASTGPFPSGEPIFWTKQADFTFDHVFALAFRTTVDGNAVPDGVFTGVAAGYTNEDKAIVVGFLLDGTTKKIGFLQKGTGDDPSLLSAWAGGVDSNGDPTLAPATFDWSTLHSYRLTKDRAGNIRLFVDGEITETLRILGGDAPYLEELPGPFQSLQGVFFGSISRPGENQSTWDFIRYQILPSNPLQTAPSSFVSYEGTEGPEVSTPPWTPIGFHGTETIQSATSLILDSTSATTAGTASSAGLIGADFRGFTRLEPLLAVSSDVVLDFGLQVRTSTSGITPNAITAAIDDGSRLTQVSFLQDQEAPKFSYGGRSLPEDATPVAWQVMGSATATMQGRLLRVEDATTSSGLIYFVDDNTPTSSPLRAAGNDNWMLEFRANVVSYTPDPLGFCGVMGQVYDGTRTVGVILEEVSGVRYVTLASDGVLVTGGRFAFEWNDGEPHTYRAVKSAVGALISLFVDTIFIGSVGYAAFAMPAPLSVGVYSFGSATAASTAAISVALWNYFNVWKVAEGRRYVGIWRGYDPDSLSGYHLPLKAAGRGAQAVGNTLQDPNGDFIARGVVLGDRLVIDYGVDKGTYIVSSVIGPTALLLQPSGVTTISVNVSEHVSVRDAYGTQVAELSEYVPTSESMVTGAPGFLDIQEAPTPVIESLVGFDPPNTIQSPIVVGTSFAAATIVDYRIPKQTDWSVMHKYRVVRDPGGGVALLIDTDPNPLIRTTYDEVNLPSSSVGVFQQIAGGLPSISFGAFDPTNISQTAWDFVRYGITRSSAEDRIVPPHHILNQRNIMASPEHLTTTLPHQHTDFWSSSTGIPPQVDPDLLRHPALVSYTRLNQGTPIVPLTQTSEIRVPVPVLESVSGLNRPEDVLNGPGNFVLSDPAVRIRLLVPDDVLYNSLQVIEQATGVPELLAPVCDDLVSLGTLSWQKEVCLKYDGSVLPENDVLAGTPWTLVSDIPGDVATSASSGILSYATGGSRTIYRNETPLTDPISLPNEIKYRVRVVTDASGGVGDSQIRLGFSAPGLTMGLGLVTTPYGDRYVFIYDLKAQAIVGGLPFDFLDGDFHTYRIVKDPSAGFVDLFIDQ